MLECPRCHRVNPNEAVFCHFDGAELRAVPGRDNTQRDIRLPHEFVFPSGRRCQTYTELIQGCQAEWEVARDLLGRGVFGQFLAAAGRTDLAQAAARAAKSHLDPDIALDTFMTSLPAKAEQGPRLDLSPRRLNLGTLHVGDTRQLRLAIINQGKGLLHGTLAVAEGAGWLRLGEAKGNGECLIKTARQQEITVRVDTHGLAAPNKYAAKLTLITNGGIVEVPVGLDLEVRPFPRPPFQGVSSPREMAEKMRTHPKPAVPLLESGEIARWFEFNGWTYPVSDPPAKGVAAVQQFFEGMGLSKPPVVELADPEVFQSCSQGEMIQGQLRLYTSAKKWVYARAESDVPWLRVPTQNVSGPQQAVIAFEANSQHLQPGRVHEGNVKITANAGQTLAVPVRIEVRRPETTATKPGVHPLLVGAAAGLVTRLLLAVPADLYARVLTSPAVRDVPPGSFASWLESPPGSGELVNQFVKHFVLVTWWLGAVVGAVLLWRRGNRRTDVVCGLITGAVAGLAVSASFACLLPGLDWLPRLVWHQVAPGTTWASATGLVWLRTPVWVVLAAANWAFWGALVGVVLSCLGRPGARLLSRVEGALAWLFQLCGLQRMAAFFTPP